MFNIIFICIFSFLLAWGVLFLLSRIRLHLKGMVISGFVDKKQRRKYSGSEGDVYANLLIIRYKDQFGAEKKFAEQNSIPDIFYKKGDKISLIFDPKKPERIMVKHYLVLYSAPFAMILIACVAGYVGFYT